MSTLLTASILLLLLWPAYALLLHYSDRYALNRFLLVLAMVAVCALPFVSLESPAPVITQRVQGSIEYVEQTVYQAPVVSKAIEAPLIELAVEKQLADTFTPTESMATKAQPIALVYFCGVALMLLLLLGRMFVLLTLHLRSRRQENLGYRLLHAGASPGQAFTFGSNLYFSADVPEGPDFEHILNHERVHARQLHTVDILLTEAFLCVFWFHPAAWWLRIQMRANLEYLVDKAVVSQGADRRNYQMALVRQSVAAQGLALALPFSEPSLKSRISRLTGIPGYRAIGILAAVALTFWMGVAMVVINGSDGADVSGADAGAGEYLAAMAGPGDPYYAHYNLAFSEPVTSVEIYTNRMVTGDEYLQLRALMGQIPGARLYAFKQAYDNGYSLELRIGNNEPATLTHLKPEGTQKWLYMLGVEPTGNGFHIPVAMNLEREKQFPDGDTGGMIRYLTSTQTNSELSFYKISPDEVEDELLVRINRKLVSLAKVREELYQEIDVEKAFVNGVNVLDIGADEWPKVVTEGRQIPSPRQRLMDILAKGDPNSKLKIHRTNRSTNGTYRQWFEDLGLHSSDETGMARRYNDRFARLDFLLDTDFGPNSMIQVGYRTDNPGGMILVQVIDDTPQRVIDRALTDDRLHTLNLYLKRLPTPEEIEFIRPYLAGFPGYDLKLYQSCTDPSGSYTLHLGRKNENIRGYAGWEAGGVLSRPKSMQLIRHGQAGISPLVFGQTDLPAGAPNRNILLEIDGEFIGVPEKNVPDYNVEKMDAPIPHESLRCKLGLNSTSGFFSGEWTHVFRSTGPETLEYLVKTLKAADLADRPHRYFIGEREVDRLAFDAYPETLGAYAQVGALQKVAGSEVVLQIVE